MLQSRLGGSKRDDRVLTEVLPIHFARPALDNKCLGRLIDMIGNHCVGDAEARSRDVLGRVGQYSLSQFVSAEGSRAGELHTLHCFVRLLVEMPEPLGRVLWPCRAVDQPHSCPRRWKRQRRKNTQRYLDLWPPVELHGMMASQDEPRHPRYQGGRSPMATAPATTGSRACWRTSFWPTRRSTSQSGAASGWSPRSARPTVSR